MRTATGRGAFAGLLAGVMVVSAVGCLSVKTENEIKPIHITMDINLKVDRELERTFGEESVRRPSSRFAPVKALLDRQAAGVNMRSMLEPREKATEDDRIFIAETNESRLKRFRDIASSSGVSLEAVQKRSYRKFCENVPKGSGVWYQDESGTWRQK